MNSFKPNRILNDIQKFLAIKKNQKKLLENNLSKIIDNIVNYFSKNLKREIVRPKKQVSFDSFEEIISVTAGIKREKDKLVFGDFLDDFDRPY